MPGIRIGVSGWNYAGWRGRFYPDDLPHRRELEYAARTFDTLEVNGTFYRLTTARAARNWRETAPPEFIYSVKGSRFITHNKKLADVEGPLANFLAAGPLELGDKLGPFLWQLSANLRFDARRLEQFLSLLPSDMQQAADLARRHDDRVKDPGFGPDGGLALRHVLEVRHESFLNQDLVELLRRHGVALAFSHSSVWPYVEEITSPFVYVRLHGPGRLYDSSYGEAELARWAEKVRAWEAGGEPEEAVRISGLSPPAGERRDVYVYFDNDGHAYAPREAMALRRLVSGE